MDSLAEGDYQVYVKPVGYLSKEIDLTLSYGSEYLVSFIEEFIGGDMDDNDIINTTDYEILAAAYEAGEYLTIGDLDSSGQKNSIDLSIISSNLTESGVLP